MEATCYSALNLSIIIYIFGVLGILVHKKNLIKLIISIELMFLGLGLLFIIFSIISLNTIGQVYALLILAVSSCETVAFISVIIIVHGLGGSIDVSYLSQFKN